MSPESLDDFLPFVRAECAAVSEALWRVGLDPDAKWVQAVHAQAETPLQGWKLHVSATVLSAEDVLRRALPVLLAEPGRFKVAPTPQALHSLNEGRAGLSQIGKFLTVYPNDDAQAVRLAAALDAATRGLPGPRIPSDRPLASGSLVHYRYGGFGGLRLRTPLGENLPAVRTPEGAIIPDARGTAYDPPSWAVDPFLAAGLSAELPLPSPLIGGRYLRTTTLHQSPRGVVYLAVDTVAAQPCVVKMARRDAAVGRDGQNGQDRLRHEAAVLAALAPDPRFPAPLTLESQDSDLYLAMEDVEGETLEVVVGRRAKQGVFLRGEQIRAWGQELAEMLHAVHAHGYVYRDLKSPNVVVALDGSLRLLDFELAHALSASEAVGGRGTRGYLSPQQAREEAPHPADDVYSLGAVLFFMATGAEPSLSPHADALLERPLCLLNPALSPALAAVIARCLAPDRAQRFASMAEVTAALAALSDEAVTDVSPSGLPDEDSPNRVRSLARRLGDTLCRTAVSGPTPRGRFWKSRHSASHGAAAWDINTGSAGTVLALAEIVSEFRDSTHAQTLAEAAEALRCLPFPAPQALPGLYVGEAGIGAALLRAGQVLGDDCLRASASARGAWIAAQPFTSPDLFNGTAGRLRFHLWLGDLQSAVAAGEAILEAREATPDGGCCWRIPDGYGPMSGVVSLGYAHGAAGIADALLDLFDATGDGRCCEAAAQTAHWLLSLAEPCLGDNSGLAWPPGEGRALTSAFWCHGAAGIGKFYLHAAQSGAFDGALNIAKRAARATAQGTRWAGPTQCHGLAGNIEFLLDMYQATEDAAYLADARALGRLLEAFGSETPDGLVWPSESPLIFSPDFQVGYAGVAACFLRLSAPDRLSHALSKKAFRP